MIRKLLLISMLWGLPLLAGSFDKYEWKLSFLPAQGYYQVLLSIDYEYRTEGRFEPNVLALPNSDNLPIFKMRIKVDGKKVEPLALDQVTYWSHGKPLPTWVPSEEGEKVKVHATFNVKNLFLIPPAPTNLSVPVKRLFAGFAPIPGFDLTGTYIGTSYEFASQKIANRSQGDPSVLYGVWRKNVPASDQQELMFLIPKSFTFSFNNLRGVQWDPSGAIVTGGPVSSNNLLGGTGGTNAGSAGSGNLDARAGHSGFSMTGDLKPYSASFYKGNPNRDWLYVLTWLQQERTYLPFGIQPGGRVKSRTLFKGAGDKMTDLIPWVDPLEKSRGDLAPEAEEFVRPDETPDISRSTTMLETLEVFLGDFRAQLNIDRSLSRLVSYETKDGKVSPALANRMFANELKRRYNLDGVPSLTSIFPQDRIAALPLSAFDGVITGVKVGKNWFFVDAANPNWGFARSILYLKGHSVVILDGENIQMGAF